MAKDEQVEWLDPRLVLMALAEIKPDCPHPVKRVVWKLGTAEFLCKECETLFPYREVQPIVQRISKEKQSAE